jgi:NAD(P)-dependent dehydrogenase (short-subunit alcohol dehydrogenase family)
VIAALRGGPLRLEKVFASEIRAYPDRLIGLDLHLDRPETFDAAVRLVQERFSGKLDALINNAGFGLFGALEDLTDAQLRQQLEVNFFGQAGLTRALLPALRAARGRVICVSSVCGRFGFPFYTAYNASKYALEGLIEAMHFELRPFGVQVCLVEPGAFATEFGTRSRLWGERSFAPASLYHERSEALDHYVSGSSKRLGNPMRVARLLACYATRWRRLPLRRPIGPDSWAMWLAGRLLPTRLRLAVIDFAFKRVVFRD